MKETQVSAFISDDTKRELEKLARARGLKKGFVIEQALLFYMRAVRELPPEALIPPRLVVSPDAYDVVARMAATGTRPTAALRKLAKSKPKV